MPDHWGFVVAAYGLAALVLGAYWRRLVRRERELAPAEETPAATPPGTEADRAAPAAVRRGAPP